MECKDALKSYIDVLPNQAKASELMVKYVKIIREQQQEIIQLRETIKQLQSSHANDASKPAD